MKNTRNVVLGLLLSLGLSVVAHAKHEGGKHHGKDKGPCAEIECEKGDKFCGEKKHECHGKEFQNKLAEAKKNGISADKKAKWTEMLTKRIAEKKERVQKMQSKVTEMEANLKEVQALKAK
jgi:hypothetical protein